jgi:hypothetical protein
MPAAPRCSARSRAYGRDDPYRTAIRCAGADRSAEVTIRTTHRTSSSASEACTTLVAVRSNPALARRGPASSERTTPRSARIVGEPGDRAYLAAPCQLFEKCRDAGGKILRQEQHHRADLRAERRPVGQRADGGASQVGHVVPVVGKERGDPAVQAGEVGGDRLAAGGDHLMRGPVDLAQLPVGPDQRHHRRGVRRHVGEYPGVFAQRLPPRRRQHRIGGGTPSATGQRRRGKALGQAIHRQYRQARDTGTVANPARERPPGNHPTQLRRYQDRHLPQRVGALDLGDNRPQGGIGRFPIGSPRHRTGTHADPAPQVRR